jgi:hypothetical protein
MLYLVSSNGYTTSSIYVRTLGQATETYIALRDLAPFKDAVWTLKTDRHWLHDHANGVGEPDWWYEVAPDRYAPYPETRASRTARRDPESNGRPPGKAMFGAGAGSRLHQLGASPPA